MTFVRPRVRYAGRIPSQAPYLNCFVGLQSAYYAPPPVAPFADHRDQASYLFVSICKMALLVYIDA